MQVHDRKSFINTTGNSTPAEQSPETVAGHQRTGLTRHLDRFFDRNHDRRITLPETYTGVRDLGVGAVPAAAVSLAINIGLGRATGGGLFTVDLNNIVQGMHPGDAEILDDAGRTQDQRIDDMFAKYANTYPNALTKEEVQTFRLDNNAADPETKTPDRLAAKGEWELLFEVGARPNEDGVPVLTRDRVNEFFHGDLFDTIAAEQKQDQAERNIFGRAMNAVFGKSAFVAELVGSVFTGR